MVTGVVRDSECPLTVFVSKVGLAAPEGDNH
jgi:hypothetical protein